MSRQSFRFAVPTTARHFTAAQSSTTVARNIRAQLAQEATPDDEAALFIVADSTYGLGSVSANFDGAKKTTWPPGTSFVTRVKGSQVSKVPDEVWGKNVIAMRLNGSTVVDVIISGEGSQGETQVAAPTTIGDYTAASAGDVSALAWPAEAGWAAGATASDEAEVYLSDDDTIAAGSGVPAGAQYIGIVGGGSALVLPKVLLATRAIVRRTKGTGALNVLFSGQGADSNNIGGANAYVNATDDVSITAGDDVDITAGDNLAITANNLASITSSTGSVAVEATEGSVALQAGSGVTVNAVGAITLVSTTGSVGMGAATDLNLSGQETVTVQSGSVVSLIAQGGATLDVTKNGVVPPTFTTAERDALTSVAAGTVCENSTTSKLNHRSAAGWEEISTVRGVWGADAGLTNAAAQSLGAGSRATTSLSALAGIVQVNEGSVSELRVYFVGDAANSGGQTIVATLLKNAGAVAGAATAPIPTTAGPQTGSIAFTPVAVAPGDRLSVIFMPSAPLAGTFFTLATATVK